MATMMEKTPTNTPNNVRLERSLCPASALIAMLKLSRASPNRMEVGLAVIRKLPRVEYFVFRFRVGLPLYASRFTFYLSRSFPTPQRVHRIHSRRPPCREKA